jgi:hypothetical protein
MSTVDEALVQLRAKAQHCAGNLRAQKAAALQQLKLSQQPHASSPGGHTPSGEGLGATPGC